MDGKTYKSVEDMVRGVLGDKDGDKFEKEQAARELANNLSAIRCLKNLSQAELAKKIGCSQSAISKIEHSKDAMISIGELQMYAQALELQVIISFENQGECAVNKIKYHAAEIRKQLDILSHAAGKDVKIFEGVAKFFNEAMLNVLAIFAESAKKLDSHARKLKGGSIQIISLRPENKEKKEEAAIPV
jgi:transcriptional regulator with XRE-family HTH domain